MKTSGRGIASLVVVAAVVGSVLSAASGPSRPGSSALPAVSPVPVAPDVASAAQAARSQGSRVEVLDQRTSTRTVFANPDGTETAELTAVPVRVRQGNEWRPIDTTLGARGDGRVGPKAAEGDVSFSGGGSSAALATLRHDGRTLSLYWPGELPKPELSGNTATYREVLPGTDLMMLAERSGLQQHLVVKNAEAARNPALTSIRLGMRADGLRVTVDEAGALHAVDDAGTEVFTAQPSVMWDSSGRTTRINVSVVDDSLVLVPDLAFLTDPTVVYPVTIDPRLETLRWDQWATVLSGPRFQDSSFWGKSAAPRDPWIAQVGQCYNANGDCNGIGEAWTYLQFDTRFMADKMVVEGPVFRTTATYSPSCQGRDHELWGALDTIKSWTTWKNKPQNNRIARFGAPTAYPGCDGARSVGIPLGANYSPSNYSVYYLRAADGNDQLAWRRYDPAQTTWAVTYNRAPHRPTGLRTDPPLPPPCKWCGGTPYVGDDNIRLIATLSDPDDDRVYPAWRVQVSGAPLDIRDHGWDYKASGEPHSTDVNLTDKHGRSVTWWVHGVDGHAGSELAAAPGPFIVDRIGITALPEVKSAEYPSDNAWHGAKDSPGVFTFSPGAVCNPQNDVVGVCDIDRYIYSWQDPPSGLESVDANALGGSATVTLAPTGDGPRTLYVQSVDRAGHRSQDTARYRILVRAGNGPRSQWSLESNPNDTAFLGDRHGTLTGNVTYGPGAVGTGLHFDGAVGSRMTAPNTVRTDGSFSVSAWVRLDERNGGGVAVEQRGTADAGFALHYHGQLQRWIFVMPGVDSPNQTAWHFVQSPEVAALGTWTHLAGTYDSGTRLMTMYVNGNPVGTTTRQTPWNAAGAVELGRSWPGMIDEVQLYDRVLGPAEVRAVVSRDNVRAGHWKFDEQEGTTAGNSIDGGDALVLKDGAAFTDAGAVNRAVRFDGGNDHAATGRPAVRTDQSFTVAAWVWTDRPVDAGRAMTAVSQDGEFNSGFYLQYTGGNWVFLKESNDTASPQWIAAIANQKPVTRTWVHLAGTYNAADGKMTIYVNGQFGGETTHTGPAWDAKGSLTVGRAKFAGQLTDYWSGAVDEVRMYSRVLDQQELEGIVSRNDVPSASWKLDGNGIDDSKSGKHGTLVNGPSWTSGQSSYPDPADLAINLDGADDYLKAAPVVDTTQSYSVSAWVRLGKREAGWHAVATQSGSAAVAFTLGYSGTDGSTGPADRWAFQINGPHQLNPNSSRVSSGSVVQVGVWTHLAAVFQPGSREMWLYVNGIQAGYGKLLDTVTPFNAQTEFWIGRSMANGTFGSYFAGAIDDVKVYSRPLFADEVRLMAGRELNLTHNWRLDEPSGSRAVDSVGQREATVTGGVARDSGRAGYAVRLNGTGEVSTTGVDLPTNESFTVSAWVNLDDPGACPNTCQTSAVSLDGGQASSHSKFRLGHRIDKDQANLRYGKWIFDMPEQDGSVTQAAISTKEGQVGTWVFLVGVYDKPAGQLWLYVLTGEDPDFSSGTLEEPWNSTGAMRIGRDTRNGAASGFWRGNVDDVRLYRGDLDADRIGALYRSYPASAPSPALPEADAGRWKFDENTGTTAADSSGREQTATLLGGAGWNPAGRIGPTNWLDGVRGFVQTTPTTVNNTEEGFSVSAWVYQTTATGGKRTVIAQDAGATSAFLLQYRESERDWVVEVPGTTPVLVKSAEPAMVGLWTHLAVTYDRRIGQVRFYVNGKESVTQRDVSIPKSTGPLTFGRGKRNNVNTEFFPGAVDDVRAFSKPLSSGEVRRVHDDAPEVQYGYWGFEDTAADTSWRNNPTTLSSTGASFGPGVRGQALQLDGRTGSANPSFFGVNMVDTFTVAAWAKLSSTESDATILAQDGTRTSGFVLQYNKDVGRWIFGAAKQDADINERVYARSPNAPVLNRWTHLTGVYDYPAGQLRLYVDGELVHTQETPLWPAWGAFTIGRGKHNGVPVGFFSGALDEVQTHHAVLPDAEIKRLASRPAPAGGQLNRFVNSAGEHYTANSTADHTQPFSPVPAGYHLEGPLGKLLASEQPGTRKLYACQDGTDEFTATVATCGGGTARKLADLGWAYIAPPVGVATVAVYRCATTSNERMDSLDPACEGNGNTQQEMLGYTVAYSALIRYVHRPDWEHTTTVYGVPPGYEREETMGLLAMTQVVGTQTLWSCRNGTDEFATTAANCPVGTKMASLGRLWTNPPTNAPSRPIYLCQMTNGERFNSIRSDCEGASNVPPIQLGHLASATPVPVPAS